MTTRENVTEEKKKLKSLIGFLSSNKIDNCNREEERKTRRKEEKIQKNLQNKSKNKNKCFS